MSEHEHGYAVDLDNIPQQWKDEIQRVSQYLIAIASSAFDVDNDHLSDVCDIAGAAIGKVIDQIDRSRFYDLGNGEFTTLPYIIQGLPTEPASTPDSEGG